MRFVLREVALVVKRNGKRSALLLVVNSSIFFFCV